MIVESWYDDADLRLPSGLRWLVNGPPGAYFDPCLRPAFGWGRRSDGVPIQPCVQLVVGLEPRAPPLIFVHLIGEMRLAQIKFALDPAASFIGELAGAEKVIGPLPLGPDH
jgi:hypothetical protein